VIPVRAVSIGGRAVSYIPMIKRAAVILCVSLFASLAAGAPPGSVPEAPAPDPNAWPDKALAVLIEHNPWAMVIGADTPRVVVFDDGTVIRRTPSKGASQRYLAVSKLAASELNDLRSALRPSASFWDLKDQYNVAPNVTDMVTTELVVYSEGRFKRVEVYGYAPEEWKPPAFTMMPSKQIADALPAEFDRLCHLLVDLAPRDEVQWSPKYVEVMIWPYEYSPDKPLEWPSGWPGLTSPMAFQRGDSYSLIVPGSKLAALEAFVARRGERQAVRIGGKKWAIAYRPVMPGGKWARDIAEREAAAAAAH
jgi:hypothetical protein